MLDAVAFQCVVDVNNEYMSAMINTRISLRKDCLSTWNEENPILANGELAIVTLDDGSESIKLGNGISSFNQLPYLYQNSITSEKIRTTELRAKSISQGYNVKSTPTSLATGIFTEADGNFDVVHGIEAKALSTDDYAFVFNGENLPGVTNRYTSHGEGSFNVNPLSGLNGFYIGEQSLSSIFNNYFLSSQISNYYNKTQINGLWLDLDNKIIVVDNKLSDYYKKTETYSKTEANSISTYLNNTKIDHGDVGSSENGHFASKLNLDDSYLTVPNINDSKDGGTFYIEYSSSIGGGALPPISDRAWGAGCTYQFYMRYGSENPYFQGEMSIYENEQQGGNLVFHIKSDDGFPIQIDADILYGQNLTFDNLYDMEDREYSWSFPFGSQEITASIRICPYYDAHAYPREYTDKLLENVRNDIPTQISEIENDVNYLLSSNLSFNYDSSSKYIYLKAFGNDIGTVNCADFIKDGMLSSVQLCGNVLVFKFNTDAGTTPISVNLSSFVDNYDGKIAYLSSAISVDVKNLADNYYKKTETSSSTQISSTFDSKVKIGKYEDGEYTLSSTNLSIINIAADDYYRLVSEEKIYKDVIYILSSDNINAHGQTIINVANPIFSDDAATKAYVDNSISGIDLSDYYKKSETSSSMQLSTAFGNYYTKDELSVQVSATVDALMDRMMQMEYGNILTVEF